MRLMSQLLSELDISTWLRALVAFVRRFWRGLWGQAIRIRARGAAKIEAMTGFAGGAALGVEVKAAARDAARFERWRVVCLRKSSREAGGAGAEAGEMPADRQQRPAPRSCFRATRDRTSGGRCPQKLRTSRKCTSSIRPSAPSKNFFPRQLASCFPKQLGLLRLGSRGSDETLAFPSKIFSCVAPDGKRKHDLIDARLC